MMKNIKSKYLSGEMILSGDIIKYHGEAGEVEFAITKSSRDWDKYWNQMGEGVMLKVPSFGSVYVPFSDDNLEFISRNADNIEDNA